MRPVYLFVALLFFSAFAVAVKAPQEQVIGLSASEAPALVVIKGNLDFPYFIADVENRANITVGLALSQMSISSIAADNLTVYVLVQPNKTDSLLYFGGNPGAKSYYLTLSCKIVNGSCGQGSVTERTISIYFKSSSEAPLKGDGILLRASVTPLISEQLNASEIALNQSAYEQVNDLQARILSAASGLLGIMGQAANATNGALNDISTTVTINSSNSTAAVANTSITDPLLLKAAQAASDAKKSILAGDYASAHRLSNLSESYLAQYEAQEKAKAASLETSPSNSSISPMIGAFLSSIAKPEYAICIILLACCAVFVFRQGSKRKGGRGKSGYLDFDGL